MKFGVFFLLQSPYAESSAEVYRRALAEMAYADELGYDSVWVAEHHFSNYGYCPNPLPLAVKIAQVTRRVRIGTAVLVLPFWHPLRLAEDIAQVDLLTEGRLDIGVARGYQPYEFTRFGLDIEESRERSDETLAVLLQALTTRGFTFEGRHYQIPEATTYPRPLQQPHPPIWLAATTLESFHTAVRFGLNCFNTGSVRPITAPQTAWQHFQAARAALGSTGPFEFGLQQHIQIAPTDREARARIEHSRWHFRHTNLLRSGAARVTCGVAEDDPIADEPSLDAFYESLTIAGGPERVRDRLEQYRATIGFTQLNCFFNLGNLDAETVRSSMRLFAEQVMPYFR
jgi:alkanesulfonate monooxygenase SsuD/methylene tetrahydromethanopterin reductase-like flavin-dependent oxidoreductase (luciferase family)